jgi:AcrR family transcriptional regulator
VAAEAFAKNGLDGASLNDILRRAEVGKGSFYHRFADKAALHDWVTGVLAAELLARVRPPRPEDLTATGFRPELSDLLDRLGRSATTDPELMYLGLMFHNSADVAAERAVAGVRRSVIAWLTTALRAGQELAVIREDLPLDLLTTWTIASLTAIDQWTLSATTPIVDRQRVAQAAIAELWRVLAPSE